MTRALFCGFGLIFGLATLGWSQSDDPYFQGNSAASQQRRTPAPRASVESQGGGAFAQAPEGVHFYPERSFEIPVQLHDEQARELRMFVSANGGRQWQLYRRELPTVTRIPFACRNDGEYWFALYTVNPQNSSQPMPNEFEPMLKMRIDTQRPRLQGEALSSPAGGLVVRWEAEDSNLNPGSLGIDYRPRMTTGREASWQPLAFDLPPGTGEGRYRGDVTLWPETAARNLEVRIRVADWAGHESSVIREVELPLVAQRTPDVTSPDGSVVSGGSRLASGETPAKPDPQRVAWPSGQPLESQAEQTAGLRGTAAQAISTSKPADGGDSSSTGSAPTNAGEGWASSAPQRQFVAPNREEASRLAGEAPTARLPNDTAPSSESGLGKTDAALASESWARQTDEALPTRRVAARPWEDASSRETLRGQEGVEELPPPQAETQLNTPRTRVPGEVSESNSISMLSPQSGIPAGEVARLTREASFRMSYEVESVGRAGVAKVQLWMTDDGGKTWQIWSEDADCESPISVQVPREGLFGFQLVVTARNGLAGEPPRPGDLADMWVEVDRTEPHAMLTEAPLGEGAQEGKLLIRWEADDKNLGSRPVTLYFSSSSSGPWNVLAAGLPNVGQYDWTIVPSLPRQVFLRLEVRDRAGNVANDVLNYPVDLSSLSPRGSLKGLISNN